MFGFVRGPVAGKYLFFTLSPAVSNLRCVNERGGRKTQTYLLELPAGRFVINRFALTATRLDIVEKLSNRFKHGMLLRRACATVTGCAMNKWAELLHPARSEVYSVGRTKYLLAP